MEKWNVAKMGIAAYTATIAVAETLYDSIATFPIFIQNAQNRNSRKTNLTHEIRKREMYGKPISFGEIKL